LISMRDYQNNELSELAAIIRLFTGKSRAFAFAPKWPPLLDDHTGLHLSSRLYYSSNAPVRTSPPRR
jgi:hypothetical protein